jgi:hypothetical protein
LSDSKRTGSRDISDLKARLGLKKGNAGAPATASPTRPNGVVAPPGLNLPPPPGVQPSQPVIPNAAEDPFAAMNAMAAVGTVQRAPEIVIVNDGRPVESVGTKSTGVQVAKIAVPALVALLLGTQIGSIGRKAAIYNDGLGEAKAILGDKSIPSSIAYLKQILSQIDTTLDESKTRTNYRPDAETNKKLQTLAKSLEVDAKIFSARQGALEAPDYQQLVTFYAGVAEVKLAIENHLANARVEANAFTKAKEKSETTTLKPEVNSDFAGEPKFAVLIEAPSDDDPSGPFGARLIEIGGLYCDKNTKSSAVAKCPEGASRTHVAYRSEISSTVTSAGELASPAEAIPGKRVVPLLTGSVRDQFLKGAEGVASEVYYQRRLKAIHERVCKREKDGNCSTASLLDVGNRLESKIEAESKKGTRFSFFM